MAVALPIIAMAASAAAAAQSAISQASAANFNAQVGERNALLARRSTVDAQARGAEAAGIARMKGSQIIGQARAAAAGGNIDVQAPNVLDSIGTTRLMSSYDAETTKNNAMREALGFESQAQNFEAKAAYDRASVGPMLAGTLLTGAGNMMSTGYQVGLFPKFGA